jgi:hypothetical protein
MNTRTELIERLTRKNEDGSLAEITEEDQQSCADMLEADGKYDQQAMELCEVCGWKAKMDGEPCLVCQLPKTDKLQAAARLALDALTYQGTMRPTRRKRSAGQKPSPH